MTNCNWETLYRSKLDWAYKGRDKFISSLNIDEFKDLYKTNNAGKPNVAVFGNSQVGKTTLILKLLGINDADNLHKILRGNQKQGKSVTATTMVYLRSEIENDEYFYYKEFDNPEQKLTGEELSEILQKLRSSIERGVYQLPDIEKNSMVRIKIPQSYFTNPKIKLAINIIDLPGVNSAIEREHQYVNALIKKVLPFVDIILLVESSNNFARLENIGIPEIERFYVIPERFRLIMTYTYKNGSEEKWLTIKKEINKDIILERMKSGEVLGSMKDFPIELKIYPIEIGDSWINFKRDNPSLFNHVLGINNDFINDLTADINQSITEHNRLMQMVKLTNTIKISIQKKVNGFDELLKNYEKKKGTPLKDIDNYNRGIKGNEAEIKRLTDKLENYTIEKIKLFNYDKVDASKPSKLAAILRERIHEIKNMISDYFEEERKHWGKSIVAEITEKTDKVLKHRLKSQIVDLEGKSFDTFFLRDKDGYLKDAKQSSNDAVDEITEIINEYRKEIKRNKKEALQEEINTNNNEIMLWKEKKKKLDKVINELNNKINETQKVKTDFIQKSEEDIKSSEYFFEFLKTEYLELKNSLIKTINSEKNASTKLCIFTFLYQVTLELEKLEGQIL